MDERANKPTGRGRRAGDAAATADQPQIDRSQDAERPTLPGHTRVGLTALTMGSLMSLGLMLAGAWWLAVPVIIGAITLAWVAAFRLHRGEYSQLVRIAGTIDRLGQTAFVRRGGIGNGAVTPPDAEDRPHDLDWLERRVALRESLLGPRLEFLILTRATLRAIADGIDTPVFATDEAGILRLVNRAGERIFGRREGKLSGVEFEELFPQQAFRALIDRAQRGEACRGEVTLAVDETPRVFEVALNPVRLDIQHLPSSSKPRAGVVMTLRDVTELSRTLQLRTDFVANASHELRTPIASIRGAVETLASIGDDDAEMRARLVTMIEQNNLRLEEMVADLLDLSNLESEQRPVRSEVVSIAEACGTIRTIFDAICRERKLTIEASVPDEIDQIRTDPNLFMLILRNLVDNATKHAFEGTTITVSAERASSENAEEPTAPRGITLRVTDRGEGIPLKHQARIFERFYQVSQSRTRDGRRAGTGLGLAIVRHAAKRLGGDVGVESVWQEGTTVSVVLPSAIGSTSETTDDADASSPPPPRFGPRA